MNSFKFGDRVRLKDLQIDGTIVGIPDSKVKYYVVGTHLGDFYRFEGELELAVQQPQTAAPAKPKFVVGDQVRTSWGEEATVTEVSTIASPTLYGIRINKTGSRSHVLEGVLTLVAVGAQKDPHVAIPTTYQAPSPDGSSRGFAEAVAAASNYYNATMGGYWDQDNEEKAKLREQRKKEGRCQECGDLLPMSIHGLLECPKHPSAPPAKQ